MTKFLAFKGLHEQTQPLLIGNVWNVQSAKAFEKSGFQAIATSSAAIAHSLGYEDGEQMPFSDLLHVVTRISNSVSLPLSVDIESGYGKNAREIAGNIKALARTGVVGINIEDSEMADAQRLMKDTQQFALLLEEVKHILSKESITVFFNVRCDAFLLNVPDALQTATQRVKRYEAAGAEGIFLPCIIRENNIVQICAETVLPLNVMCMPGLPDFKTLGKLGVKRISMGNFLNGSVYTSLEKLTQVILSEQSFNAVF